MRKQDKKLHARSFITKIPECQVDDDVENF